MNEALLKHTVETHPFLRDMTPEHQQFISDSAHVASFEPGQIIFREGEPANECFIIQQGKVALEAYQSSNNNVVVQTLGPQEVFGWSWLFAPYAWHFTARALEPTTAIVLNGAHLLVHAEHEHNFGYALMKHIARLLMKRLEVARRDLINQKADELLTA